MAADSLTNRPIEAQLDLAAEACRVLEMAGHGDKVLGHVSLRDPEGRGFWMKRAGAALSEIQGPDDFVLVDFDGHKIAGDAQRHAEWPIHGEIFRARPDINCIGHTHPFAAAVMATNEAPLVPVTRAGAFFAAAVPRYRVTSNLIIDVPMGQGLADALGGADAVLMQNHGVTYGGPTIAHCAVAGVLLEEACRAQLLANGSGFRWSPATEAGAARLRLSDDQIDRAWAFLRRKAARPFAVAPGAAPAPEGENADLALAHRLLANEGHEFLTAGAVARRAGEGFVTKRAGLALSEIFGERDLAAIPLSGMGDDALPEESLFSAVFRARQDVGATVWTEAPAVAVFAATDAELAPTGDEGKHFEGAWARVADASAPAGAVAEALGDGRAVLLGNAGGLVVGPNVRVALLRALFLEKACALQLAAGAAGYDWGWLSDSDLGALGMTLEGKRQVDGFWDFYCRKLARREAGAPLPGEI